MPQLQTMGGRAVRGPVTVVAGSMLPLKVLPLTGEKLPFDVRVAGPGIVAIDALSNRTGPHFATFRLRGLTQGDTRLELSDASGRAPLVVAVAVQPVLVLPTDDTDAGLLARMFLAESPGPGAASYSPETSRDAMTLMRVVLENRRAKPSARWGSAGAHTLADVARARGQFEGFGAYPTLSPPVAARIAELLRIANAADDGRQPSMRAHVERVIALASELPPKDPSSTGLYWWRTEGSGAPGAGVTLFRSVLGNSFYREGP